MLAARESLLDFFEDFADLPSNFLVFDNGYRARSYTYRQVSTAAAHLAQRLLNAGIRPGDKVVLWGENRPEWIAAFWGCLLVRAVVVPVDYRSSLDLLQRIVNTVAARVVLAGDEVPALPAHWPMSGLTWDAQTIHHYAHSNITRGEICEIIFTSGATASPKGVTITHANILANITPVETEIRKYRKWSIPFAPIRFLNLLPLSHLFGQSMATFIPPMLSGEVVFITGYNPREIQRQIHSRRISVLVSVPKILEVLRDYVLAAVPKAAQPPPPGANWMRRWWHYREVHNLFGWKFWAFIVGAAPLDPDLEEFWSKLGFVVVQGYGLTETAPIVTLNHPFHTSKGSVGKPIGGVEVRIAPDSEILVRGPNVTSGYFHSEAAEPGDDMAFADGWFHTGDIGEVDAEGRVFIRGRKKEMIVTPEGLNIFPEDIERVFNSIEGVVESAVVGSGRAHAVLVLKAGAVPEHVIASANQRLESHQQIRDFSVWTEGPLPRTEGTSKLKRVALGEWIAGASPAPRANSPSETLLPEYSDDTPLTQLGLSSLDRVELLMQAERGSGTVNESAFAKATTVGELRGLAQTQSTTPAGEPVRFPRWTRSFPARLLRRVALPLFLLPLLRIFVWLRVEGRQYLPLTGPVLFAVNHQSVFDVPTILAAMPSPWRYRTATAMGLDWFRNYRSGPLQYFLACLCFNAFPLPQHEAGSREALRYMGDLAANGWSVLIFPEGVRTNAGEIHPFRPGAGMIASRLQLPVVPVRIEGLDRVLHQSWKFPSPGRVGVTFGPPLELAGDDYQALAAQIEKAVRAMGSGPESSEAPMDSTLSGSGASGKPYRRS